MTRRRTSTSALPADNSPSAEPADARVSGVCLNEAYAPPADIAPVVVGVLLLMWWWLAAAAMLPLLVVVVAVGLMVVATAATAAAMVIVLLSA